VPQLDNKVFDIIDARCHREVRRNLSLIMLNNYVMLCYV